MELDENTGEFISLAQALTYVSDFRREYPTQLKGFFAGRNKIDEILAQPDCIGLRIYNGYNTQERRTNLIILGVDSSQRDMTEGLIADKFGMCPPFCDVTSPLSQ